MKYQYLLWDIDGTLLDFLASERNAVKTLFQRFGLGECTDEMVAIYSQINVKYWKALERGEIKKPEMLVARYREFFKTVNINPDLAEDFNACYQVELGETICFMENAKELLEKLKEEKMIQIAVTNGTKVAQNNKMKKSGMDRIFDFIFISEDIGFEKPDVKFFEHVFSKTGITDLSKVLIVGDSLTSDMKGGMNAGIDTCWYNPKHVENTSGLKVDYEIKSLWEILKILEFNS